MYKYFHVTPVHCLHCCSISALKALCAAENCVLKEKVHWNELLKSGLPDKELSKIHKAHLLTSSESRDKMLLYIKKKNHFSVLGHSNLLPAKTNRQLFCSLIFLFDFLLFSSLGWRKALLKSFIKLLTYTLLSVSQTPRGFWGWIKVGFCRPSVRVIYVTQHSRPLVYTTHN